MTTQPSFAGAAVRHLIDLLRAEGPSGGEGRVAGLIEKKLAAAGCPSAWMRRDRAHKRIGQGFETGNLIVRIPGTISGPRLMFSCHLDTVPLVRGAVPVLRGDRIRPRGRTALGADNRTGAACLVTLAEILRTRRLPHPPLTLMFAVGEEVGLLGSRHADAADLGQPAMGFNYDSGDPAQLITAAIGASRWEARVHGIAAHAGVHPEKGASALVIAARAIDALARGGWLGRIRKGRRAGTANAGVIEGGRATNEVTDLVRVLGEARSHDPRFLAVILRQIRKAFAAAASSVRNEAGRRGRVELEIRPAYRAFRLPDRAPVVRRALEAARSIGLKPFTAATNGGLDANMYFEKGIPTVTLGAGQHNPHSLDEYVDVAEYIAGCRLALALARGGSERSAPASSPRREPGRGAPHLGSP